MELIESKVFVVLQVTRGRSEVMAVFNEENHAQKFILKLSPHGGTLIFQESTLYDFEPSVDEIYAKVREQVIL